MNKHLHHPLLEAILFHYMPRGKDKTTHSQSGTLPLEPALRAVLQAAVLQDKVKDKIIAQKRKCLTLRCLLKLPYRFHVQLSDKMANIN